MTFLLLLVSVAVLEYILSRPKGVEGQTGGKKKTVESSHPVSQARVEGLMALSQALERESSETKPEQAPKVHSEPLDRV